jgi:poly(A) polymerase
LAEQVAARLRLSIAQRKRLATAAGRDGAVSDPRALTPGARRSADRLLLAGASTMPLTGWDVPRFPLKGGEIVARGSARGRTWRASCGP